ncbi:hypothetical protein BHE74_00006498 [Ensete ventricosum]|nr:hypothetical protein BHE74_00006498 [Ensete ventricosum]
MEVLSPSPPRSPAVDRYGRGGPAHGAALRFLLDRASPGPRDAGSGKLYVAVGRSPEKTLGLLRWAFRRFECREIGLLHLNLLWNMQVHASVIVTETDQIQNGIVDIVTQHGIKKLVMGSTSDNCFKLIGNSSKTTFTAKNVPPFCEIWFVSKGRHIWTREASEFTDDLLPDELDQDILYDQLKEVAAEVERSKREAFIELAKRKQLESEVAEAVNRVSNNSTYVHVLGKIKHPHLVTLIGMCPEALSIVYEYMPNGTLQDRLFCRATPMNWKIRARITAEISSALLFLHSCKPENIVHGDLKPENIFLDYSYNCKLGNFGVCRLIQQDTAHNPTLCRYREPQAAFPYSDPEYQMTMESTTKSDVYSFGIIILQLLTGKPARGLSGEVRRALLSGNLKLMLDPSAGEWPTDVARKLAEIGLQCSGLNAQDRPELTPEMVNDLGYLHLMEERPVPPFFLCPILQASVNGKLALGHLFITSKILVDILAAHCLVTLIPHTLNAAGDHA